jgi:hypothetical protein
MVGFQPFEVPRGEQHTDEQLSYAKESATARRVMLRRLLDEGLALIDGVDRVA